MPIFGQKNVNPVKYHILWANFFKYNIQNPLLSRSYLVKNNVNSVKTTVYYGPKKSIGIPFFSILNKKMTALMPIFCPKNDKFLNNPLLSCPYFVKKTYILSKTRLHVIFFQNFHEKCLPVMSIFGPKMSILSKLNYIMGQKSQ